MDNTAKLKAGHPKKFFHPSLGFVDAEKGLKANQVKVLEAEGRIEGSKPAPAANKGKDA